MSQRYNELCFGYKRTGLVVWYMASQPVDVGSNPGAHLCFPNSSVNLSRSTVNKNKTETEQNLRNISVECVIFPIRTGATW